MPYGGPVASPGRPGRDRRLSRRLLLTQLGTGTVGVAVLSACGSGGDESTTDPTTSAPGEPDPAETSTPADPPTPADTSAPSTESDGAGAGAGAADPLQWHHVSLGFVSAYVLVRGREAAVVDTGTAGSEADILAGLDVLGATPDDVRHVILTHRHPDHVGGLGAVLDAAVKASVHAGTGDIDGIQSARPLQAVGDGDEVFGMGVIGTPGHTPGSISLFDTDTGLLIAGDAINGDDGRLIGPNPDFSTDIETAVASLDKLAVLDARVAAFGHGGPPITSDVADQLRSLAE